VVARVLEEEGVAVDEQVIPSLLIEIMRDVIRMSKFGFERTLRDILYKTGRLVKDNYTGQDAEGEAIKIRDSYEMLNDFDALRRVAPAKEAVKELIVRVKADYGVQLSTKRLLRALTKEDLAKSLVDTLQAVVNPSLVLLPEVATT